MDYGRDSEELVYNNNPQSGLNYYNPANSLGQNSSWEYNPISGSYEQMDYLSGPSNRLPSDFSAQPPAAARSPAANTALTAPMAPPAPMAPLATKTQVQVSAPGKKWYDYLAPAASLIGGISGVAGLVMSWWATNKQLAEQKKAREEARKASERDFNENKRRYEDSKAFAAEQFKETKRQNMLEMGLKSEKQTHDIATENTNLAISKEQQSWDRYITIMKNMMGMMSTPSSRAGFADLYRR